MKRIHVHVLIGVAVAGFLFGLFVYLDWLEASTMKITEGEAGPYVLVCEDQAGDYQYVGWTLNKMRGILENEKLETKKGVCVFFDDPREVPAAGLRSRVGCVLQDKDMWLVMGLAAKFKVKGFPKVTALMTTFPYREEKSLSKGMKKLYPRLVKAAEERGYAVHEAFQIYDMENSEITFGIHVERPNTSSGK